MPVILVIDDDKMLCQMLSRKLAKMECIPVTAHSVKEGLEKAREAEPRVVFLDVMLPDGSGLDILPQLKALPSAPEVIIFTARGTKDGAELAIRTGAWDYIAKPASLSGMILPLKRALEFQEKQAAHRPKVLKREGIVGQSPALKACLDRVAAAADSDAGVLIRGETGTGKEKTALAVHMNSGREEGPFVVVDCAALTETLAVSLLFGHVKGAFTGAVSNRTGFLKQADGGTVFLDEIGELPLDIQKVFLRALQEKQFMPIGASHMVKSNFRVVAATNRNLEEMADQGEFREDLLFRLKAFHIELPPLRERQGDIEELAFHFLKEIAGRREGGSKGMSSAFIRAMGQYGWPGNIRELINTMERSLAAAGPSPVLYPQHLPTTIRVAVASAAIENFDGKDISPAESPDSTMRFHTPPPSLQEVRDRTESKYLKEIMAYAEGNIKAMCEISGISRSRLYALLKKHQLFNRP